MKILTISDEECKALWDYYTPGKLREYDLILSCGDLKSEYLRFLVTMARCPLLFVHGNHDGSYKTNPPEGCDCIEDALVVINGLRILGLGGCRRYRPGPHQYTEEEMRRRIWKLRPRIRMLGGIDLVVTHAAPQGLGDGADVAHWGFSSLRELLDEFHPAYLIHGHTHMTYEANLPRFQTYQNTTVVNACERCVLEIPTEEIPREQQNQLFWKYYPGAPLFLPLRHGPNYP